MSTLETRNSDLKAIRQFPKPRAKRRVGTTRAPSPLYARSAVAAESTAISIPSAPRLLGFARPGSDIATTGEDAVTERAAEFCYPSEDSAMRTVKDRDEFMESLRNLLDELCSPDLTLTEGRLLRQRILNLLAKIEIHNN